MEHRQIKLKGSYYSPTTWRGLLLIFSLLLFTGNSLFAAEIKGIVKDKKNKPLPLVKVTVKDTGAHTQSGADGSFTAPVPENKKSVVLVFEPEGSYPVEKRVYITGKVQVFKFEFLSRDFVREKVSVTATTTETRGVDIPAAKTSVSALEIQAKLPESIVDTLADTPGVHFIGKGGHAVTPSIRGLARRRVLLLVDGARVTGDRRVGTSATFMSPELVHRLEVSRSAASVLYGSDALGGVVNILTHPTDLSQPAEVMPNSINLNYNTVNKRINGGIKYNKDFGNWHLSSGFQYSNAGDYQSPEQEIENSGYAYYSGILNLAYSTPKHDLFLGYAGGLGKDVGKPERANNPEKYALVPTESTHFFRASYRAKQLISTGSLGLSLYLNPTTYITEKHDLQKERFEKADTRVFNLGIKSFLKKDLSERFSYEFGVEWFSRQNLDIGNLVEQESAVTDDSVPLENGGRDDLSLYGAFKYSLTRNLGIDAGLRYTFFSISAIASGEAYDKDTGSTSYFLGLTRKFSPSVSAFFNLGRAFRFPSISEALYTGLTGRKYVVGNPALVPESSFSLDGGIKISTSKLFIGAYVFSYWVDDLIERYKDSEGIYHYDNIHRGRIYGGELEWRYTPNRFLSFYGHYFYYRGRGELDDEPLNDIPAPRFLLGAKVTLDRFWVECDFLHSFKKDDPGPAEEVNKAYNLVNIKGGYYLSSSLFLYLKFSNLLNETYYANPDTDIPEAHGFSVSTGVHFYF